MSANVLRAVQAEVCAASKPLQWCDVFLAYTVCLMAIEFDILYSECLRHSIGFESHAHKSASSQAHATSQGTYVALFQRESSQRDKMTTACVEVPAGVDRVVLTLDNGEVQELRRRVEDLEVRSDLDCLWVTY